MLKPRDIVKAFEEIDCRHGDVLFVQSSYKGTGGAEGGAAGIVEGLLTVTEELGGTLVMPVCCFESWTQNHYFDRRETPSKMGVITEIFRLSPGVLRSRHPIHSFGVYGTRAREFAEMEYSSSFGPDSVFAPLQACDALYVTIGLGMKMPFMLGHHVEELMDVPWRRHKQFAGIYVDYEGPPRLASYSLFARKNIAKITELYAVNVDLYHQGHVASCPLGASDMRWVRAKPYTEVLQRVIETSPERFGPW